MKKILNNILSNWLTFVFFILTIILIVIVYRSCNSNKKAQQVANMQAKRNDSIRTIVNKLHDTVRMVNTIYEGNMNSDSLDYYRKLAAITADVKDKEIERLTKLTITISQNNKTGIDTIIRTKDSLYPIYVYKFKNNWLSYDATAKRDSLFLNSLTVRDSIDLILARKNNLLQARIVNYNPFSRLDWARDYDFRKFSKTKHWGLGVSGGATYYNGKTQPYIGVGLNYNLIQF